jgi:hypothetical protein
MYQYQIGTRSDPVPVPIWIQYRRHLEHEQTLNPN